MISTPDQPIEPIGPLLPRRNPGLVQRIANLFNRSEPQLGPQPADREGTSTGLQKAETSVMSTKFDRYFRFEIDRASIYDQVDEIDNASEEASIALDIIANNVCTSEDGKQLSWEIRSPDAAVQKIFDKTTKVAKLHQKTPPMVRNLVKYGDSFTEIVVNLQAEVADLKPLPPKTIFRNETTTGGFQMGQPTYSEGKCTNRSGECAFEQRIDTSEPIATFWPWQMMHLRLNHDGFSLYGKSHLRVSRVTFQKLKAIEQSLIVGRLTREYLKLIFYIDTTNLSPTQKKVALREFQNNVTQRISVDSRSENPFSVMTDFFISTGYIKLGNQVVASQGKVDVLDPKNVGIHDITDVEYLHRKFIATLRVPPAHLGFEKDVNAKATLTLQDTQFVRFLRSIQQQVGQGLEQIYKISLLLAGYDPENVEYEIIWPQLSATDQMNAAQSELWRGQLDQLYEEMGVIDAQWIQEHRLEMSQEERMAVNKRVEAQQQKELLQQTQQAQQTQDRQVELVKAKAQAGGFRKNKAPAESNGN